MLERDIEAYLVSRVEALGGEVRKVIWQGRRGAPDRLVMMPERSRGDLSNRPLTAMAVSVGSIPAAKPAATVWVELKAPGLAASFPSNPHERQQHREHERMRAMGQRVVVIDSHEAVDDLLL